MYLNFKKIAQGTLPIDNIGDSNPTEPGAVNYNAKVEIQTSPNTVGVRDLHYYGLASNFEKVLGGWLKKYYPNVPLHGVPQYEGPNEFDRRTMPQNIEKF